MLRFLTDQNFNNDILDGLLAGDPSLDIVRTQDCGLSRTPDEKVLEWAAGEGRVLISHDANTVVGYAYDRVQAGLPMPGVIIVRQTTSVAQAIDELLVFNGAGSDDDFKDQVRYIPMGP
jgi:hypothetical protein